MGTIVLWALLTGGITGGVWVSIVLLGNHARLRKEQGELGAAILHRRDDLAALETRLSAMERQHAELQEAMRREQLRLPPPAEH